MDHDAFLAVIREQSERFLEALNGVQADAPVPSCDGWLADDLLWHLAEVQHFWAVVAAGAPGDDGVLTVFVDGVPDWGSFTSDGTRVRLTCTNAPAAWELTLGRFTGTGPESGTHQDLDAAGALVQVRRTLVPSEVKLPQSGTPSTKTVSTSSTPSTASSTDGGRTSRPAVSCASARCTSASCAAPTRS